MNEKNLTKTQSMLEIAKLYYLDKLSQNEIAERLGIGRSSVSRMLTRAMETGVVQITINSSDSIHLELAHRIAKQYGLQDVMIVNSHSEQERTYRKAGEVLAEYLMNHIQRGTILGVSRGRINYYASRTIHNTRGVSVDVVQMMGCTVNTSPKLDSYMLTDAFASRLNGVGYVMPVPLMAKSRHIRDALLLDPLCKNVIEKYPQINVAVMDIHSLRVNLSLEFKESWLSKADAMQLRDIGAVGSTCGYYFNRKGMPCNVGINDRLIAIDREQLYGIPIRIGAAIGANMLDALLAVLRSGLLNVLVVDEALAFELDV